MKCKHLSISDEAYRNDEPVAVFLCIWPSKHIGTAPAWLKKAVGGGLMVRPEVDCVGCLCFEKQTETGN